MDTQNNTNLDRSASAPSLTAPTDSSSEKTAADGGQDYVFLICSERSGSNLISAILNTHSVIGATPPYHLCRDIGLNWHALLGGDAQSPMWPRLRQLLVQRVSQFKSPEAGVELEQWLAAQHSLSFPDIARHVFSESTELKGNRIVFVKENNIHKMLFFILQYFPGAKFVFQVRDPRDYLLSAMNLKEGRWGNKFGSSHHAMEVWRDDQLGGLAALAHLGKGRVWFQRYEDLIRDPEKVLGGLCRFLGVEFEKAMLEFNETEYASDLAVPGGPRENLSKPLMSNNAAKYRTGLTVEQIRMVEIYVGDLMERFGYRRDHPNTKNAPPSEVMMGKFLEQAERIANAQTDPFYSDNFTNQVNRNATPLVPEYENR